MNRLLFSRKRKGLVINIIGLLIGVSASILILLFVKYETSFDNYHSNNSDIYRLRYISYKQGETTMNSVLASPPMGNAIKEAFPEVKDFVRIYMQRDCIIEVDQKKYEIDLRKVAYVDHSIFTIFTIHANQYLKN